MTCQPVAIQLVMSEEAFDRHSTGKGATYWERLWRHLPCSDCGMELTAGSMIDHLRCLHGNEPAINWDRLPVIQTEHPPQVYEVRFHREKLSVSAHSQGEPGHLLPEAPYGITSTDCTDGTV